MREKVFYKSSIGSDEVGTGDFFGPIIVCATYISHDNIIKLQNLGLKDSKSLTDKRISEIAKMLLKTIPYSLVVLDNAKYNDVIKKHNMNAIKAILHNQVINNLKDKIKDDHIVIVDQFASEKNYFNYLKNEQRVTKDIHFFTKGESVHLSVAAASIIARYTFLKKFDELSNKIGYNLIKGASLKVDILASQIILDNDVNFLKSIAKMNFKTLTKALKILED